MYYPSSYITEDLPIYSILVPFFLVLEGFLCDELLVALGADADIVVSRLASDSSSAASWTTTVARLALLSIPSRRAFCRSLLGALDSVTPDVAAAVTQTLSAEWRMAGA